MCCCIIRGMKKSSWLLLLLAFSIFSCSVSEDIENLNTPEWEPDFSFALIDTDVSVSELLNEWDTQGTIQVDDQGLLFLSYETEFFSTTGADLYEVPDVVIPVIDSSLKGPNPFGEVELFTLKEGSLSYEVDLVLAGAHRITLILENLSENGVTFSREISGSGPGKLEGSWDLNGMDFDFRNDSVSIRYIAEHLPTDQRIRVFPFFLEMKDMDFSYAQGYFGQYDFQLDSDTIALDGLGEDVDIEYLLAEAELNLTTANSFGIPIQLNVDEFSMITQDGSTIIIESDVLTNGIRFNYPTINEVGELKATEILIDEENSNIHTVLSSRPAQIQYGFNAQAHPDNDPEERGFITDTSQFEVDLSVYVPLYGSISQYTRQDTFSLSLEDLEMGRYARFKIVGENEIPLDIILQAYFLDAQGQVIDSLSQIPFTVLESPDVDTNGEVIASKKTETSVEIEEARFSRLIDTESMVMKYSLSTADNGTAVAKFLSESKLDVKIGLQVGVQNPD